MNRRVASPLPCLAAAALALSGCRAPTPPAPSPPAPPVHIPEQVDEGGYVIMPGLGTGTGAATPVAAIWSGKRRSDGKTVEFWAHLASFGSATSFTIEPDNQPTCQSWWHAHCGSGVTYSRTTNTAGGTPFDCTMDAGASFLAAQPDAGTSFLPPASFSVTDPDGGAPFAWISVQSTIEYWAMNGEIGASGHRTSLMKMGTPDTTPEAFLLRLCLPGSGALLPKIWFTPSYTQPKSMSCDSVPDECN
jgi:hypothetical protein